MPVHQKIDLTRLDPFVHGLGKSVLAEIKEQFAALFLELEQQSPALVPDGWRLVPVEPTPEMVKAGARCASSNMCWSEMLAASPQPVAQPEQQEQSGPIVDGWELSAGDGHSGYGVYAHMTEYPDEGAVLLLPLGKPEQQAVQGEAVGYMNAGHVHELQQGRLPYGYVYPAQGTGAEIAVFTHQQPDRVALTDEQDRALCEAHGKEASDEYFRTAHNSTHS